LDSAASYTEARDVDGRYLRDAARVGARTAARTGVGTILRRIPLAGDILADLVFPEPPQVISVQEFGDGVTLSRNDPHTPFGLYVGDERIGTGWDEGGLIRLEDYEAVGQRLGRDLQTEYLLLQTETEAVPVVRESGQRGRNGNPLPYVLTREEQGDRPVLFGQRRIDPTFRSNRAESPEYIRGRPIEEVAGRLRSGEIDPLSVHVEAFEYRGQIVALSNRTLAALSEAGLKPRLVIMTTPTQRQIDRLGESPIFAGQTLPGPRIAVTPSQSNLTVMNRPGTRQPWIISIVP
jgi:hypothetical protein